MNLAKKFKVLFVILLINFFYIKNSFSFENKILFKVNNEIITTIDIYEETRFLKIFNPEINNLNESELFEVSKNSILRDKIKKTEILNFVKDLKVDDKFLLLFIKNKYPKMIINTIENFENYLRKNDLNVGHIKEKLYIELIWNDLIFKKFNKQVIIDKEKIKMKYYKIPKKSVK